MKYYQLGGTVIVFGVIFVAISSVLLLVKQKVGRWYE